MLFLLSIIILIATVLLWGSILRLSRVSDLILAWALSAYAAMVLVFQLANLGSALNSIPVILSIQVLLLFFGLGLWLKTGRPVLLPENLPGLSVRSMLQNKNNWPVGILVFALLGVFALYLVLIYIVPPNNNDALAIHIARVIKWMQIGSYFPWETPFIWQLTFPVNAQLTYLWTTLFTRSDHFIAYIPFLAGIATALVIYCFARELGFTSRLSCFSALIWLTFPVVQLHLTSVRHDLVSTWLFVSALYFFLRWSNTHRPAYMILSGLAFGLVIGTNFSIAAYLPGLAIVMLSGLFTRTITFKQLTTWAGVALLSFFLFSSPIYISNWIHFHSPVGPDAADMTSVAVTEEIPLINYLLINTTRWFYQLLDFSWLPGSSGLIAVQGKAWLALRLQNLFGINLEGNLAAMNAHEFYWNTSYDLQEDEAWFGLIGALLIFPTSLIAFCKGIKKHQFLWCVPFIFFITSMITCSLIRPGWTPYDGRYFMPLAALCTAWLPIWMRGKKSAAVVQYLILGVSLFSLLMVVVFNPAKQIVGGAAIWNMNRIDRMTRQSYTSKEMLYLVEAAIPEDATVGIATDHIDYQEYGVFGENFTRRIINVDPPEMTADSMWLDQREVEYLLILISKEYPSQIAPVFKYVDSLGDWVVYARAATK